MQNLSLITWNVNLRYGKQPQQFAKLHEYSPDIVCLQEVTPRSFVRWSELLSEAGYNLSDSYTFMGDEAIEKGARRSGLLIASKFSQRLHEIKIDIPWRERILSAILDTSFGSLEIHNVHMPSGSSHGYTKVETFEGVYSALAKNVTFPRIVCGDFNSPKEETLEGKTIPFGNKSDKKWRKAELDVIRGLADFDLMDVYRACNGYDDVDVKSWMRKNQGNYYGARLDHIFASQKLNPVNCIYNTDVIFDGLSDHAIMYAQFEPDI